MFKIFCNRNKVESSIPYSRELQYNDNDNEIDLFRHHNGNNTNIKVIFKQVTMLDKCNRIWWQGDNIATIKFVDGIWSPVIIL